MRRVQYTHSSIHLKLESVKAKRREKNMPKCCIGRHRYVLLLPCINTDSLARLQAANKLIKLKVRKIHPKRLEEKN